MRDSLPLSVCLRLIRTHPGTYYAYLLLRPDGTPFYAGCGHGERIRFHRDQAQTTARSTKLSIIRKILRDGHEVSYRVVCFHDHWEQVLDVERKLIAKYGRIDLVTGTLANRTSGGEGGFDPCDETRQRIATAVRIRWQNEKNRSRMSVKMKALWADPVYRERCRSGISKANSLPARKIVLSAASKARWAVNRDVYVAKLTAKWKDEESRSRRCEAIRRGMNTPELVEQRRKSKRIKVMPTKEEVKQRRSTSMKARWADADFRARREVANLKAMTLESHRQRQGEMSKIRWADPEFREKMCAAQRARWIVPGLREKQSASIKKAWAAKRSKPASYTNETAIDSLRGTAAANVVTEVPGTADGSTIVGLVA